MQNVIFKVKTKYAESFFFKFALISSTTQFKKKFTMHLQIILNQLIQNCNKDN